MNNASLTVVFEAFVYYASVFQKAIGPRGSEEPRAPWVVQENVHASQLNVSAVSPCVVR